MVAKLETRAKDLEAELDSEQRRLGDATKNFRKCERGIKELTFRQDEDRKNNERMHDLVDKLQQQVFVLLKKKLAQKIYDLFFQMKIFSITF